MRTRVIGVDPGPTPGIVYLEYVGQPSLWLRDRVEIVQCSAGLLPDLIGSLIDLCPSTDPVLVAVEKFVPRGRLTREQSLTRDQVQLVHSVAKTCGTESFARPAVQVKKWATDERLHAAGLMDLTKGMRHAKDAARHALYAAVVDCGTPDPLSRRSR